MPFPCSAAPDVRLGGLAPWRIRRLQAFVEEHLSQSIHIVDLSGAVGLSVPHFSRAFGLSFGEPPHLYVIQRRLDRARHLMLTSDIALSELAATCGFSDQAHFCRLFRRDTGKTPAAWRREWRASIRANEAHPALLPIVTQLRPAPRIARSLGLHEVVIKDETTQPTGSLKDRASAVAVARAAALGYQHIACASSGNAAIATANDSIFGLSGGVITRDIARGERIAAEIESGCVFVNDNVRSDPRLPFGGVKESGYGRELSHYGIKEFVNIKTIVVS